MHRPADIERSNRPGDLEIARLAERQHGVVERGQLRRLGFGHGAIQHRIRSGRLHRLHRGVYAVGRKAVSREGRWFAAVLACGPDAVLSHRSAAALWQLLPSAPGRVDVTVPGRTRRGDGTIVLHNVRRLHGGDRRRREGIPITSVARTLLDVAEVVPRRRLVQVIDTAERLGLFDLWALDELCERSKGRRGLQPLADALRRYRPTAPLTRSNLERRFIEICDRAGLPRPAMNLFVAGFQVDAAWLDKRLVVEVDSFEFHRTRAAFETDRLRDTALQRQGLRVLRVTDRRLNDDPAGIAEDLRSLCA